MRYFLAFICLLFILAIAYEVIGLRPFREAGVAEEKGDFAEANRILRPVAERGSADAQFILGLNLASSPKHDDAEAALWYRKAAEQGHAYAAFYLGKAYRDGSGVKKDLAEAAAWFRRAAEEGNGPAQNELAGMYEHGTGGLPKDMTAAIALYTRAANQGVPGVHERLFKAYRDGDGVPRDYVEAYFRHHIRDISSFFPVQEDEETLKHLTPEQLSAVQKRIDGWRETRESWRAEILLPC